MSDIASQAARGTSLLLTQSAVSGLLRVLNISILTRLLLQSDMGVIGFLGIIYGYMQFLGTIGLNYASPLVIPEAEKEGAFGKIRVFLHRSVIVIAVSSSLMALFVFLLSPLLFGAFGISEDLIRLALIIAPFSALEAFLDSFLLGRYSVRKLAAGRILFDISRVGGTVIFVLVGLQVTGVMFGWLLGEIVAVIAFGVAAFHGLPSQSHSLLMRPILAFALPNLLFQTIDVTIQNTDRIILLHLTDLAAFGVYDVFLRILFIFSLVSLTIATSLYPILTRVRLDSSDDDGNTMNSAVSLLVRYVLMLLLPLSVIFAMNSFQVINVLFGLSYATYPNAPLAFAILLITYSIWGVTYAHYSVLRSLGESRFFIYIGLSVILFEIVLCWYLTSWLGLLGSAMTRALYVSVLFAASLQKIHGHGVHYSRMLPVSLAKILCAAIISGSILWILRPASSFDFVLLAACALTLYLVLLLPLREIKSFDFTLFYSVAPKQVHGPVQWIERKYLHS